MTETTTATAAYGRRSPKSYYSPRGGKYVRRGNGGARRNIIVSRVRVTTVRADGTVPGLRENDPGLLGTVRDRELIRVRTGGGVM